MSVCRMDQRKGGWGGANGYRLLNPGGKGLGYEGSSEISQEGLNPRRLGGRLNLMTSVMYKG